MLASGTRVKINSQGPFHAKIGSVLKYRSPIKVVVRLDGGHVLGNEFAPTDLIELGQSSTARLVYGDECHANTTAAAVTGGYGENFIGVIMSSSSNRFPTSLSDLFFASLSASPDPAIVSGRLSGDDRYWFFIYQGDHAGWYYVNADGGRVGPLSSSAASQIVTPNPDIGLDAESAEEAINELATELHELQNLESLRLNYLVQRNL